MQPFSIPVQITLQGSRKRQGRTAFPTSEKRNCRVHSNGDSTGAPRKLPSSAGEDRAMLLGFVMMGSSVLMFFLLGTTILKPFVLRQREETNCTVIHAHITDTRLDCSVICGANCQSLDKYPCLQVLVNLTHLGRKALLHYDEEAVHINPKCFYTPKCHQDGNDLLTSALDIKEFFDHRNGTPFACFYSPDSQSEDVILIKSDQMVFNSLNEHREKEICYHWWDRNVCSSSLLKLEEQTLRVPGLFTS